MWTAPTSYSLSGWAGFGGAPVFETTQTTKNLAERSPVVTERRTAILTESSPDGSNSKTPSFPQRAPCGSKRGPSCGSHREPPSVRTKSLPAAQQCSRAVLTESPGGSHIKLLLFGRRALAVLTESSRRGSDRDPTNARVRVLTVICRFGAHGQHCRSLVDGRWCAMYFEH